MSPEIKAGKSSKGGPNDNPEDSFLKFLGDIDGYKIVLMVLAFILFLFIAYVLVTY